MLYFVLSVCLMAIGLHVSPSQSFSLPLQCSNVFCDDGFLCVVNDTLHANCKPISSKAGSCPADVQNPECLRLIGAPRCLLDEQCPESTKCCRGCCEEAVRENPRRPHTAEKLGSCPPGIKFASVYWWTALFCPDTGIIDDCQQDLQCDGPQKCCPGLCGKECSHPVFQLQQDELRTTTTTTATTEATTTTTTTTVDPVEAPANASDAEAGNATVSNSSTSNGLNANIRFMVEPPLVQDGDSGNFTRLMIEPPLIEEGDSKNYTRLMIEPPLVDEGDSQNYTRLMIEPPLVEEGDSQNYTRLMIEPPLVEEGDSKNYTRLRIEPPLGNEADGHNITRLMIEPPLFDNARNGSTAENATLQTGESSPHTY